MGAGSGGRDASGSPSSELSSSSRIAFARSARVFMASTPRRCALREIAFCAAERRLLGLYSLIEEKENEGDDRSLICGPDEGEREIRRLGTTTRLLYEMSQHLVNVTDRVSLHKGACLSSPLIDLRRRTTVTTTIEQQLLPVPHRRFYIPYMF